MMLLEFTSWEHSCKYEFILSSQSVIKRRTGGEVKRGSDLSPMI